MEQNTLYILLVEKKFIMRERFQKRLQHNDEVRFQFLRWLMKNHKLQRHFECYMHRNKETHMYFMQRYHQYHCMEFKVHISLETKILFDTYEMAEYYHIEREFYLWLSSTIQKIIMDQYKMRHTEVQLHKPLEYVSRTIVSYPDLSDSLFQTQHISTIVDRYTTIVQKIAASLYYLVGEILGYNIKYPKMLQPNYYKN